MHLESIHLPNPPIMIVTRADCLLWDVREICDDNSRIGKQCLSLAFAQSVQLFLLFEGSNRVKKYDRNVGPLSNHGWMDS